MDRVLELTANEGSARLDSFIAAALPELSRTRIQKLIAVGLVTVNGLQARASRKLTPGDRVSVTRTPEADKTPRAEAIPLNIVYEDDDLIVIDKPPGLTVHPAQGRSRGTLVNALLHRYPDLPATDDEQRPGIIHRLDRNTSGLMLVAKNQSALIELAAQFKERTVKKIYLTLVKGHLSPGSGIIEAPIGRHKEKRQKMAIVIEGKESLTEYRVLRYYKDQTLLEVMPQTGRTHQIRVHLAAIGFPVLGDSMYGVKSPHFKRQFLHAQRLEFSLPSSGERISLTSKLPADLEQGLKNLS